MYCTIYVSTRDNSEEFLPPSFSLLNIKHKMLLFLITNAKYGKLILCILMFSCLLQFNLLKVLFLDSCVCTSVSLLMRVIIFHLPLKGLTNRNDSLPNVKEHVIFMPRIRTKHFSIVQNQLWVNEWTGGGIKRRNREEIHEVSHLRELGTEMNGFIVFVKEARPLKGN